LFCDAEWWGESLWRRLMTYSKSSKNESKDWLRTYATLCIYHDSVDPEAITKVLKLKPDRLVKIGDPLLLKKKASSSGWFLGAKDVLRSNNYESHIEWILKKLKKKKKELVLLSKSGFRIWIFCFWESLYGNGGPVLEHKFIKFLSEFPISLSFDVWLLNKKQA
jgi:hypothetical protein